MPFVFANNVNTTLFAACTSTATSIAVTDATNLPTTLIDGQQLALVITSSPSAFEVVYVTAIDGTTLTVLRGQEGSTAQAWAAGVTVMNGPTQGQMASFVQSVSPADPTPAAGQILVGQSDGAVPAFVTPSGDATVDATGAFALSNTGVAAGVYGGAGVSPQITVSAEGRVTAAENIANGGAPSMLPGIAAAANVNVTVATPGSNIDGYVLSAGDVVLLTAQSTSSQNGLWQYASATSPLTRPVYSAVGSTLSAGTEVSVGNGSTYTGYTGTLGASAVVGTDAQGWTLRPQVLVFTAPLTQTGASVTLGVTPVASGGTGVSTLAADGVLVGNGSGPVMVATTGNAGNLLVDQGSGNAPVFVKMSGDATLSDTGVLTLSASSGAVTSVFGRAGAVTGQAGDYTVQQVTGAAPLASPVFTGTPEAPTQPLGTDSNAIATTAFVQANAGSGGDVSSVFGRSGAVVAEGGDYAVAQVTGAAPLASPVFTGNPTAPTPADGDNSTSIATTAFVTANAGGGLVTSVFGRKGAVTALAGDYQVTQVTGAAPLASPEFSGVPTVPTPAVTDNTTQIANTEYVQLNTKKAASVGNGEPNIPSPVKGQMYIDETNSSLYAYYASESTASPQYVRTAQAANGSNPDLEGGPNANNVVLGTVTMWNNAPAIDGGWSTLGTLQPSGQITGTALGWVTGVTALPLMNNNGTAVNTAIEISGCAPPVTWALVPVANQVEYAYSVQPSTINDLIVLVLAGSNQGTPVTFTATDSNGHTNVSGLSTAFVAAWVAGTTDLVSGTITVSSTTYLGPMAVLALQPIDGNDAWQPLSNDVTSVFGRQGNVQAATGDYTVAEVTGAAPLDSPALTGTPTAPTPAARDDSTKIATTAYVAQNTIGPVPAAAGDVPVGNAAATAYASVAVSGDATLSDTGAMTVVSTHLTAALPVAQGGTGVATLPANAVLIGNGTSAPTGVTMTDGQLLVGVTGSSPIAQTVTGDVDWNGASAQVVSTHLTDPLPAAQGGLGAASLTAHGVVVAEGTAAATVAATGTAGRILLDQGPNADPLFAAMSGDATITAPGIITVSKTAGAAIASQLYVQSRNGGLVTNGSGLLGTNYNFPGTTFITSDLPGGFGAFKVTGASKTLSTEAFPALVPLTLSGALKRLGAQGTGASYLGFMPLDIDGAEMKPQYCTAYSGTNTTLAALLNPGDTTITLASATGWPTGTLGSQGLYLQWWPFTSDSGFVYPTYSYSRNSSELAAPGATITANGNVLTLPTAYAGPALAAGTAVRAGQTAGTYMYVAAVGVTPSNTVWTTYSGTVTGFAAAGGGFTNTLWPLYAASATFVWLANNGGDASIVEALGNVTAYPMNASAFT